MNTIERELLSYLQNPSSVPLSFLQKLEQLYSNKQYNTIKAILLEKYKGETRERIERVNPIFAQWCSTLLDEADGLCSSFLELDICWTCNLACKYCYQRPFFKRFDDDTAYLKFDTGLKLVDRFVKLVKTANPDVDSVKIELFGGEPTLNQPVFDRFLKEVREWDGVRIQYIIFTNLTRFSEALCEAWHADSICQLQGSIDDPFNHNLFRPYIDGSDSWSTCISNLLRYLKSGVYMTPRSDIFDLSNISQVLYFRRWLYEQYGVSQFSATLLLQGEHEICGIRGHTEFWLAVIARFIKSQMPTLPNAFLCPMYCIFCPVPCRSLSTRFNIVQDRILTPVPIHNNGLFNDVRTDIWTEGVAKWLSTSNDETKSKYIEFLLSRCYKPTKEEVDVLLDLDREFVRRYFGALVDIAKWTQHVGLTDMLRNCVDEVLGIPTVPSYIKRLISWVG